MPGDSSKSLIHKSIASYIKAGFNRFQGVLHQSASKKRHPFVRYWQKYGIDLDLWIRL